MQICYRCPHVRLHNYSPNRASFITERIIKLAQKCNKNTRVLWNCEWLTLKFPHGSVLIAMEACFCHWIKNKKGNCDFLSHNSDYFSHNCMIQTRNCETKLQFWEIKSELRDINYSEFFLRIEFISCNSDFITRNCKFISQFWEKKVRIARFFLAIVIL